MLYTLFRRAKKIVVGGLNLSAKFTSDTTLTLTSDDDFYLAGELRPLRQGSVAGTTSRIGEPVSATHAKAVNELKRQ